MKPLKFLYIRLIVEIGIESRRGGGGGGCTLDDLPWINTSDLSCLWGSVALLGAMLDQSLTNFKLE